MSYEPGTVRLPKAPDVRNLVAVAAGSVVLGLVSDRVVRIDMSAGTMTYQLPSPGEMAGVWLSITVVTAGNTLTIADTDDSEGWSDLTDLDTALDNRLFFCDGFGWRYGWTDIT